MVSGILEGGTNAGSSTGGHAMRGSGQHGMVQDDTVVTLSSIIETVGKFGPAEKSCLNLESLKICRILRTLSRMGSKRTFIDSLFLFGIDNHPT